MERTTLHQRIAMVIGERSFRDVGEITGVNHETARRYVQGQAPSIEFLTALCNHFRINAEWMLCGEGAMHREEIRGHSLREAQPAELLGAVADMMQKLIERVDRLEVFVQSVETRLRVEAGARRRAVPVLREQGGAIPSDNGETGVVSVSRAAERPAAEIADAVAPGPRRAPRGDAQARRA
jgi:transcriptional regulator with XRE-family HTH domain